MKHIFTIILAAASIAAADPADTTLCPPSWSESVIYYQSFDSPDGRPEVNTANLQLQDSLVLGDSGVHGRCGVPAVDASGRHKVVRLMAENAALSPHRPLSISLWWRLENDLPPQGGFNLIQLQGRGYISHFARGGPWCALKDTAGVVQIYNLPSINNVNGIYDPQLRQHVGLTRGQWHHAAMVISGASLVSVYTDGRLVFESRTAGRAFMPEDGFKSLTLGGGVSLDEIIVLDRCLSAEEIADYASGIKQMREAYGTAR